MNRQLAFRTAWLGLLVAASAQARITVQATNGGTYTLNSYANNEYDLTLHATYDKITSFTISRTTASDVLRFIDVYSSNADGETELVIAQTNQEILDINEINLLDNDGYARISRMDISGNLGATELNAIADTRIGGSITGKLLLRQFPGIRSYLSASVSGNVLDDITLEDSGEAPFGLLDILYVAGTMGTANDPIDVRVGGWIGNIEAGEINATIRGTGASGESTYVGQVFQIESKIRNGSSGDFRGEVRCRMTDFDDIEVDRWIRAYGDFEGTVYIGGSFADKEAYDSEIETLQSAGFKGRLIINALNESGVWTAPVNIGPTGNQISLSGNNYNPSGNYPNSAQSLGGGTIGKVPFYLHRTDCLPQHNQVWDPNDSENPVSNKVCMRHYGPVTWDTNNGNPYKVERRKAGSSNSWVEQTCFTCEMDEDNDTIVWVKTNSVSAFQRGFEYQVSRRTFNNGGTTENVLRCDLPTGTPQVANFDPLIFRVCDSNPPAALGGADDNGIVDEDDYDSIMNNWGSTACMKYGDADRNGGVNSADLDIAELYQEWEYCYAQGQGMMLPQGDGFASLGFAEQEAASAAPMTLSQAVAAMGYASVEAFGEEFDAYDDTQRGLVRSVLMALVRGE